MQISLKNESLDIAEINLLLYTAKNATDLMQVVVDFTGLMQFANKSCIEPVDFIRLDQVCEHQTCCNSIFADLLLVDETTYIKPACSSQLAASTDLLSSSRRRRCERIFISAW